MEPIASTSAPAEEYSKVGHAAALRAALRDFIREARAENFDGKLRCRPLSEAITCAETAYLWLGEVAGGGELDF